MSNSISQARGKHNNGKDLIMNRDNNTEKPVRLAILQQVCSSYRIPLLTKLSASAEIEMTLFYGEDVPNTKIKSGSNLKNFNHCKMNTRFLKLATRTLSWHVGLVGELRRFKPDVILCEGESHFLGYLQAIFYRCFFNRRAALMHWCFYSLPGWEAVGGKGHRSIVKRFFRPFFDAFVAYSSFSKDCLLQLGQPSEKIFVATNVGDTERFLQHANSLKETALEAKNKLGLPDRFTVLYLGTIDAIKRPDVMLDLAKECGSESFNFVLVGSGPLLEELRKRVESENLSNVFIPGRVVNELPLYYRAADALLIPGRGGIVISEAMAFGVPVIIHQADGTESDLVQDEVTGLLLKNGSLNDFRTAIESLQSNPGQCAEMGSKSEQLVRTRFTTANMVQQIICAAKFARNARLSRM